MLHDEPTNTDNDQNRSIDGSEESPSRPYQPYNQRNSHSDRRDDGSSRHSSDSRDYTQRDSSSYSNRGDSYNSRGNSYNRDDSRNGGSYRDNRSSGGGYRDDRGGSSYRDNRSGGYRDERSGSTYRDDRGGGYRDNRNSGAYRDDRGGYRDDRGGSSYRDSRSGGGYRDDRGGSSYRDNRSGGGYRDERDGSSYRDNRSGGGGYRDDRGGSSYRDNRSGGGGYRDDRGGSSYRDNRSGGGSYRDDRGGYRDNRSGGGSYRDDRGSYRDNRSGGGYRDDRGGYRDNRSGGYRGDDRSENFRRDGASRFERTRRDAPRQYNTRQYSEGRGYANDSHTSRVPPPQRPTTLIKALVRLHYASRGISLNSVQQELVTVNEKINTHPNSTVRILQDIIKVEGLFLMHNPKNIYIVMNKPRRVAGSPEDDSRHIMSLVAKKHGWYIPCGALPKSVSGITILTNDPEQCHPEKNLFALMEKEYWFKVHKVITRRGLNKLQEAIEALHPLNDGVVKVDVAQKNTRNSWMSVVVRKAKITDISKIIKNSGLEILAIECKRVGTLSSDTLPSGSWRRLQEEELSTVIHRSVTKEQVSNATENDAPDANPIWHKLFQRWFANA